MSDGDNVLPWIPAQYVAEALKRLPAAESAAFGVMEVAIDVPILGAVLITARRMRSQRVNSTHYFWTAESAVRQAQ
jgi:hypothetical protein